MLKSKLSEQKSYSHSRELPLASIIITSYNYEKFLPRAIDSALQQTYPLKETIVVDDGSTDNSRQIINQYKNKITPVFQENRGLCSATNAGFFASRGEIIFFLDADDFFFPHKVEEMVKFYLQVMPQDPDVMIFHRVDCTTNERIIRKVRPKRLRTLNGLKKNGPFEKLSDPEAAYRHIQKWGFLPFLTSPSTGLSLTRSLAKRIFPLPEEIKNSSQDRLLVYGSMLLGKVYGISQVLSSYIIHGNNMSITKPGFTDGGNVIPTTEKFLNDILQTIDKDRIVSFYESRYAQAYYRYNVSTKGLLGLTYKIPARCFCLETIWFSMKTLWYCLISALGVKKKHRENKKKMLRKLKENQPKQHS